MTTILPLTKRSQPSDGFDRRFRGLGLPVTKRPGGYFQASFSRELIRSSIFTILSTRKGERVFLPEFGSALYSLVFEPNDAVTRKLVKQAVTEDVNRWEKRVRVRDVRMTSVDHDITVYIEYEILNTSLVDAATITFSSRTFTANLSN